MRYWSYLAAKIAVASVTLYGLLYLLDIYFSYDTITLTAPKIHATRPGPPVPPAKARPATDPGAQQDVIWVVPGAVTTPAEEAKLLAPLSNGGQRLACNLALMGWFLLATGAGYLIVWDQ